MSASVARHAVSPPRILVVDDDPAVRHLLARLLGEFSTLIAEAGSVDEAIASLSRATPDLILLDLHLPGRSGRDLLEFIRGRDATRLIPVVMLTGDGSNGHREDAFLAGASHFIAKPFDPRDLRARVNSLLALKRATDRLEQPEAMLVALAAVLDARSPHTYGHSQRVSECARRLAEAIGLPPDEVDCIARGSLFHDIGKIAVPDRVLFKPGRLDSNEYEEMKRHPLVGCDLASHLKSMEAMLPIILHHHERMDGSGYPHGLRAEQIPLHARIVAIADVFDALTHPRPYRDAWTADAAIAILVEETRRGWWDSTLVEAFAAMWAREPRERTAGGEWIVPRGLR